MSIPKSEKLQMFCHHCNEELFDKDFENGTAILQEYWGNIYTADPHAPPGLTETHLSCFERVEGGGG